VSLHRVLELLAARLRLQVEHRVEREELELVAMRAVPRRRAGAAIAVLAEAVRALRRRVDAFVEPAFERVDAPGEPVGEVPDRGVGS